MRQHEITKNHRDIIRGNIDRDPVGSKLTETAKQRATDFALKVWDGQMGNGEASDIGIKHVTSETFKE